MDPAKYLQETEHAVHQLFDGIAYYRSILEEMPVPVFVTSISYDDNKEAWNNAFDKWSEENKEAIDRSYKISREYLGLSFSNATLCGSVLQIAFMGISLFSNNNVIPSSCKRFVNKAEKGKDAVRYCIGREVRGLPIGIVIYAARNQYNHWDDPKPRRITQAVFEGLALVHGSLRDPAFDLSNPNLKIYSHNVLGLLGWHSFDGYWADIHKLLGIETR